MKFNINGYVKVRLTPNGKAILRQNYDRDTALIDPEYVVPFALPAEDGNGWSTWQLWVLMETFGPSISIGMNPPFETYIEIVTRDE